MSRRVSACTAAPTGRAPVRARTSPRCCCSTSSTAIGTSSRDCSPDNAFRRWLESGVIVKADALEELAAEAGLPADQLTATVERFNGFARSGLDADFHRGESAYGRNCGDPTSKPNPARAPACQRHGTIGHAVHRGWGQGRGRGHRKRDLSDRSRRQGVVEHPAIDLRPRGRWVRRRARTVDIDCAAGPFAGCRGATADLAAASPVVTVVRRPQPNALGSGIRCGSRFSASSPARPMHLRHRLQGERRYVPGRRREPGSLLRSLIRRRGVPR
jgi:hypothetical protein